MANLQRAQYAGSWHEGIHVPSYISGYFDGEGCFSVAIAPRITMDVGWEVRPSVSVSQNADRAEVLGEIHTYFGCGSIRPDPGDATVKWETRSLGLIRARVLPHFVMYPMRSGKQRDCELLHEICERMAQGEHLECAGLVEIVELVRVMNPSGRRRYAPDQVLRDLINKMKA